MMDTYENVEIQELPLSVPLYRRKVEDFLGRNGLRLEEVDLYLGVLDADGGILAGAGLYRDIIKCIAVSEAARSEGYSVPLISRLIALAAERGHTNVKVFTKPGNRTVFESLGFRLLASAPKAMLMENGRGLEAYCTYLRAHRAPGVIVMNANPFTLGHQYLVAQARSARRAESGNLVIIPVKEDASLFPYPERLEMIRQGSGGLADVVEGSDYQISAATFPTYFLKDLSDAAETQMRLDIDLFGRHIAPALGATVRFIGSEPADPLTARYNTLMKEMLPSYGVEVVEIPRLAAPVLLDDPVILSEAGGEVEESITASRVRAFLDEGRFRAASALTPSSTWPYLLAFLAERALRMELDAPLKPGLVCPDSSGAHRDMDYNLMRKGIAAIRPFFPCMAQAASPEELRQLGIDAEQAMLAVTGGVNTHRGAIFALGLALSAAARCAADIDLESADYQRAMQVALREITQSIFDNSLTDRELQSTPQSHGAVVVGQYGVKGAREMALGGYEDLFRSWLPYYSAVKMQPYALQRTLLFLIASLDDTCMIHRVGYERAREVKREVAALLGEIPGQAGNDGASQAGNDAGMAGWAGRLQNMCERFAAEGVSPGGAADMLALTIFADSLLN